MNPKDGSPANGGAAPDDGGVSGGDSGLDGATGRDASRDTGPSNLDAAPEDVGPPFGPPVGLYFGVACGDGNVSYMDRNGSTIQVSSCAFECPFGSGTIQPCMVDIPAGATITLTTSAYSCGTDCSAPLDVWFDDGSGAPAAPLNCTMTGQRSASCSATVKGPNASSFVGSWPNFGLGQTCARYNCPP